MYTKSGTGILLTGVSLAVLTFEFLTVSDFPYLSLSEVSVHLDLLDADDSIFLFEDSGCSHIFKAVNLPDFPYLSLSEVLVRLDLFDAGDSIFLSEDSGGCLLMVLAVALQDTILTIFSNSL